MEIIFNNKPIPQDFTAWQTAFNGDPVKRKRQWGQDNAPDRGARCLAHYICDMQGMQTIHSCVEEIVGPVSVNTIYPEGHVKFDEINGKRNHDLAFFSDEKKVFISIEAKVAEAFGKTFTYWLKKRDSQDRRDRRDSLMAFFGVDDDTLYNQLLFGLKSTITGILSTGEQMLGAIDNVDYHIMLVMVFDTPEAKKYKITNNKKEFDRFVNEIGATRVNGIESCECYLVPIGQNNYIAYKKVSYPASR